MNNDQIDSAIDAVAREMTAGDASANLRARVLADIESPRPFAWRPVFATLAVAVAVLVAVMMRVRPSAPSPVPQAARTVSPSTLGNPPSTLGNPPSTLVPQTRTLRRPASPSASAPFAEEPLKEASIAVESIAIAPMAPNASIALEELPTITPLAIPAIGQGEQR